jgi:AcrR family transcriptional regulator|tara:strand:- start:29473 stop:30132 length:660 start_codon:yes stop_codon:yes gene_type:complete
MNASAVNKHALQTSKTRERMIAVAQELYANRGIDGVSLNQILTQAGQKNRNAMQYHFGNREGLLQAIVDKHSGAIYDIRSEFIRCAQGESWSPAALAARVFVQPIASYIEKFPEGVHYVKILSQLAALNTPAIYGFQGSSLSLRMDPAHQRLTSEAVSHLSTDEAKRRTFLTVGIVFHSIADIYRVNELAQAPRVLANREKMIEQVICSLQAFYQAAPR